MASPSIGCARQSLGKPDSALAGTIVRDEVSALAQLVRERRSETDRSKLDTHTPMTAEQAAEYLQMPLGTLYMKLGSGEIPATKPGKRYFLFRDELDKWLEANRKNHVPLTAEETNAAILASHRRKPSRISLFGEGDEL